MDNKNLPAVIQTAIQSQGINTDSVNLILPSQTFGAALGKYDKVTIEIVKIDPNPDGGEVFKIGEKLSPGKVAIDKIGNALHIQWDPVHTGIIESTSTKSRAKAFGRLRMPNGDIIEMVEEKTVDLEAIEEEQAIIFEEKAEKGNFNKIKEWKKTEKGKSYPVFEPWISEKEKRDTIAIGIRKAMISYRKFKDERAMTGARERCIKALIAMKSSYTEEELLKPFAFPSVSLDISKMLDDPKTSEAAIARMTMASAEIFSRNKPKESTIRANAEDADFSVVESNSNGDNGGNGKKTTIGFPEAEEDDDDKSGLIEEYIAELQAEIKGKVELIENKEIKSRWLKWMETSSFDDIEKLKDAATRLGGNK